MLKISIALTLYNGEKYIFKQLKSIHDQTYQVDEVIICDDGSSDKSTEIVSQFISDKKLHGHWKLYINKDNKGYTRNFLDCAKMTTGNIIFFCDQDDIWYPNKIERMAKEFEKNQMVKALSCRFLIINSKDEIVKSFYNSIRKGKGNLEKRTFTSQVKDNISGGLTLAIRRETLVEIEPIIRKYNLAFDVPIGLLTSIEGGYYILWEPLMYRRVHSNNVSAPKLSLKSRLLNVNNHIEGREYHANLLKMCVEERGNQLNKVERRNLITTIKSHENYVTNLKKRAILPLVSDIFTFNPMKNYFVVSTNILCSLFGKYENINNKE